MKKQTIGEQQFLSSIATISNNDNKHQNENKIMQDKTEKEERSNQCLILHYKHEQRLASYKKDIHQLWNKTFTNTPVISTKLIVGSCNNKNATRELVSKRPSMSIK